LRCGPEVVNPGLHLNRYFACANGFIFYERYVLIF
jgi:hypothetical protein